MNAPALKIALWPLPPLDPELVVAADPDGAPAAAFRELRTQLLLEALPESAPCALAVVSTRPGDGKTYVAANLAAAFAELGSRTLLIEADLRAPRLERLMGVRVRAGLSDVLAGAAEAGEALHRIAALGSLWFMPAGAPPARPLELLQRPTLEPLLAAMKEKFDRVIVDTPAASLGGDCRVISARCTASLVLARRSETRMAELEALAGALDRSGARIAGVIVNER